MTRPAEQRSNRREMLRGSVRYAALGGVIAASSLLAVRPAERPRRGSCPRVPECCDCPALAGCKLPEAEAARKLRSEER